MKDALARASNYLRLSPGAPLLILFEVLLISCAIFLISGNSNRSVEVASLASYVLPVAISVQLASIVFVQWHQGRSTNSQSIPAAESQSQASPG